MQLISRSFPSNDRVDQRLSRILSVSARGSVYQALPLLLLRLAGGSCCRSHHALDGGFARGGLLAETETLSHFIDLEVVQGHDVESDGLTLGINIDEVRIVTLVGPGDVAIGEPHRDQD